MYKVGKTAADIVHELGLSRRRVDKWVRLTTLPDGNAMAPKPHSPASFEAYLACRWAKRGAVVRQLYAEIRQLGYTGCYT